MKSKKTCFNIIKKLRKTKSSVCGDHTLKIRDSFKRLCFFEVQSQKHVKAETISEQNHKSEAIEFIDSFALNFCGLIWICWIYLFSCVCLWVITNFWSFKRMPNQQNEAESGYSGKRTKQSNQVMNNKSKLQSNSITNIIIPLNFLNCLNLLS